MTNSIVTPESENLKRCSKCGEWKSLSAFTCDASKADGLRTKCQSCDAAYREQNRERIRARNREYMRGYYVEHKTEIQEYHSRWYSENADAEKRRTREWVEQNKDAADEYQRKYRQEHTEEARAAKNKRRAMERSSGGSYTSADLSAVRSAQTDRKGRLICWRCGKPITDTPHLDHWIPIDKQGVNSAGNLHYMHALCNLTKSNKHPFEFGRLL
jgi:hypothetical protein